MAIELNRLLRPNVRSASIGAKVIRADGRVEDLGTVAYWNRNPLRVLAWHLARLWRAIWRDR